MRGDVSSRVRRRNRSRATGRAGDGPQVMDRDWESSIGLQVLPFLLPLLLISPEIDRYWLATVEIDRYRPISGGNGVQKGHFKGMLFDHVIKNFVIQGGNSQKLEVAGDWILKGKAHSQLATSPKHEAFMLGTLKPNKDSKEFELFITTAPIPDLSDKLIIFGRVIKGEDVVQEIEEVDTDEHYRPKSPVGIVDIALKREV
ncbi:hypothetical protein GW17_00019681 [Ensete ventricosum]|nr:hypothetical protein GW17_00019681 [Ensete ventricosum]